MAFEIIRIDEELGAGFRGGNVRYGARSQEFPSTNSMLIYEMTSSEDMQQFLIWGLLMVQHHFRQPTAKE